MPSEQQNDGGNKAGNDGGPAFPGPGPWQSQGMSLRDYFAGLAMQAILAKEGCTSNAAMQVLAGTDANRDARMFAEEDARRAYLYADAMLQARMVLSDE